MKIRLLSTLLLISVFSQTTPMKMEEDSNKRKRDEEPEEIEKQQKRLKTAEEILDILQFSDLPPEIKVHVINQGILNIIKDNASKKDGIFHPLTGVREFLSSIYEANKELSEIEKEFKKELLTNTRTFVKEVFASEFINSSPEELGNKLKETLRHKYNEKNEIRAAKLIIAGAELSDFNLPIKEGVFYKIPIISMIARTGKFPNLIPLLKSKGIKLNDNYIIGTSLNYTKEAPLNTAILNGRLNVIKFLLENGANPNIEDTKGNTALIIATQRSNKEIVQMLIESGADVNARNSYDSETALMKAVRALNIDIIKLLLNSEKIDLDLKNRRNQTARDIALSELYPKEIQVIEENSSEEEREEQESEDRYDILNNIIDLIDEKEKLLRISNEKND